MIFHTRNAHTESAQRQDPTQKFARIEKRFDHMKLAHSEK